MFEFFIAKKYLIPKRKQLSASLIALISVFVISLVVWLLLLFLSITQGIERKWLEKLTSLNAPIKITPTNYYKNSYYHQIDSISSRSNYSTKSLKEKLKTENSDPYNPEEDQTIPSYFPSPDLDERGLLKDPIKLAFKSFDELKAIHPSLIADDFEITGVLMKLKLIRPSYFGEGSQGESQTFLTQMCYAASFSENSSFFHSLILPPSKEDVSHLFYLSSLSSDDTTLDIPYLTTESSSNLFQKRIEDLLSSLKTFKTCSKSEKFSLSPSFFKDDISIFAAAYVKDDSFISHFLIPNKASPQFIAESLQPSDSLIYGQLQKKDGILYFFSKNKLIKKAVNQTPMYLEEKINCEAKIISSSFPKARHLEDIKVSITSMIQNQIITGETSLDQLSITAVTALRNFKEPPKTSPLWPYFVGNKGVLPSFEDKDQGVLLPKNFKESGVLIGDRGYLSYGVATPNAMQEQRLPIYVSGFYDPGVLSVGARCIVLNGDIVHDIATSSHSFTLDDNLNSGIQVWFEDLKQTKAIAQELESLFKVNGIASYFTITTFYDYDFAKDLLQQFQSDKYLFTLIGAIILLVACSNILSFLILMINDKKKEIGVLQSMGASPRSIAAIFSLCGATLGLLGSIIGSLAAFLTLYHIDSLVHFLSLIQGQAMFHETFYGSSLPNKLSSEALFFIMISTPIISTLAALIPAIKASRLRPAITLRSE